MLEFHQGIGGGAGEPPPATTSLPGSRLGGPLPPWLCRGPLGCPCRVFWALVGPWPSRLLGTWSERGAFLTGLCTDTGWDTRVVGHPWGWKAAPNTKRQKCGPRDESGFISAYHLCPCVWRSRGILQRLCWQGLASEHEGVTAGSAVQPLVPPTYSLLPLDSERSPAAWDGFTRACCLNLRVKRGSGSGAGDLSSVTPPVCISLGRESQRAEAWDGPGTSGLQCALF